MSPNADEHKFEVVGEPYESEGPNILGKEVKAIISDTECEICGMKNIKLIWYIQK